MKFYQLLTEASQYIIPQLYKQRFLKTESTFPKILFPESRARIALVDKFLPKDAVL